MLEEITAAVRHATSFALETTLSSRSYLRQIPMWQALGYQISLYFIRLPHPVHLQLLAQREENP